MSRRFRNWICTWYTDVKEDNWKTKLEDWYTEKSHLIRFIKGQLERCPSTGRLHIQFAINFLDAKGPCVFKNSPFTHKGVRRDNGIFDYVGKEETRIDGPIQFGTMPYRANHQKDWDEIKTLVR